MGNGRITWISASDPPTAFPPVADALLEPDGLLAAGGDLSAARVLAAYRQGIFPWYEEGQPLLWWSPDPRCVFLPGGYRLTRRLRRELRKSTLEIRCNTAFADVVRACAGPRRHQQGTWITSDMMRAYEQLHRDGWAHSVEIWRDGELVGGLYGLIIGSVLFGESMYSDVPNASKTALFFLSQLLDDGTLSLIDGQVDSQHLASLGAVMIPRTQFIGLLDQFCEPQNPFANWPETPVQVSKLV
jgi:leucyl/phenylalanyl-tRNA--protein transferase